MKKYKTMINKINKIYPKLVKQTEEDLKNYDWYGLKSFDETKPEKPNKINSR